MSDLAFKFSLLQVQRIISFDRYALFLEYGLYVLNLPFFSLPSDI